MTLLLLIHWLALPVQAQKGDPKDQGEDEIVVVSRDPVGAPTVMTGALGTLDPDAPEATAHEFLQGLVLTEYGATGQEQLVHKRTQKDTVGNLHLRFEEEIFDRPVFGAELVVHAKPSGEIFAVTGRFGAARDDLATEPGLEADEAVERAVLEAEIHDSKTVAEPLLYYILGQWDGLVHLAFRTTIQYQSSAGLERDHLYADAWTGQLVARHPTIHRVKSWQTHTASNTTALPGTLLCTNGQACNDPDGQVTHDHVDFTYDFFMGNFGIDSVDGNGFNLRSTVNYGFNYNNAFWDGSQFAYGSGDGFAYQSWGSGLDVVAHEITHALTQFTSGLVYQDEPGAINEAMSDIFGAAVEALSDGGWITGDTWLMGEDIGPAIRDMSDPIAFGDTDYYPNRYTGNADNGGVHINSGIANLAFQLMVEGGSHPRGQSTNGVPAIGMVDAQRIFFDAQNFLGPYSDFAALQSATLLAASQIWGAYTTQWQSVREAWCAVGVNGLANFGVNNFGYDNAAGGWRVDKHPRMVGDVNGDGKDDLVGFGGAGVYVSLSQGGCFTPTSLWINNYGYDSAAGGWRVENHPRTIADVNGDGKEDVVAFGGAGVFVSLSTGSSFLPASLWLSDFGFDNTAGGWRVDKHPRTVADVNGDGKKDLVAFGGAGVFVALSTGTGFSSPFLAVNNFGYDVTAGGYRVDKHPRTTADVNGDGRDDILAFGGAGVYVAISNGTSFNAPSLWLANFGYDGTAGGYRVDKHPRKVIDVDGDGKDDAVAFGGAGVYVAKSTGSGFAPATLWINNFGYDVNAGGWRVEDHPRLLTDVNGDNKIDVVGYGGAGPYLATSTGTSFNPAILRVNNLGKDLTAGGWRVDHHPRLTGDMDGNGKADIVGFGGAGVYLFYN